MWSRKDSHRDDKAECPVRVSPGKRASRHLTPEWLANRKLPSASSSSTDPGRLTHSTYWVDFVSKARKTACSDPKTDSYGAFASVFKQGASSMIPDVPTAEFTLPLM